MKKLATLLEMVWPFGKSSFIIDSRESLALAAETFGILPFFPNNIRGLSVEEMCAPGMLFGGNYDEGCWEWKGPVIRKRTTAYGKFFRRKAGFVSLEILPDFLNFRRKLYPVKPDSTEEMLLDIIKENDSLSSTELKQLIFGGRRQRSWNELPDNNFNVTPTKRKSLESPLQRLQMGGHIIISDFEYKRTRNGERYGWGVARYSTPELCFPDLNVSDNDIEKSLSKIVNFVKDRFTNATKKNLSVLLR